jgi:hypothetical protein
MSGFPGQAAVSTAPLATFKAGKLQLKEISGGKFMVTPETRKGQVVTLVLGRSFQQKDELSF